LDEIKEILLDSGPAFSNKLIVEGIWPRDLFEGKDETNPFSSVVKGSSNRWRSSYLVMSYSGSNSIDSRFESPNLILKDSHMRFAFVSCCLIVA
jgi:hypothetical protein